MAISKIILNGVTQIDLTGDTVTAADMRNGVTAHGADGLQKTGSVQTQAGKTVTPTTYNQTAVSSQRITTGNVIVAGDSDLQAGNIKDGVEIFGVMGTYSGGGGGGYSIEACPLLYYDGNEQQGSIPWWWSYYDDIGVDAAHNVAIQYQYGTMNDPFYILPYLQYTGGTQSYVIEGYDNDREESYKQLAYSYYDYSSLDSDIFLRIYEGGGIVLENSYDPDITTSAYTVYLTSEYKTEPV